MLCGLAAGQVVGDVVALGRYTVGTGNGLGLTDVAWSPPLPAAVLAVAFAVAAVAWSWWLLSALAQPVYGTAESSSTVIELPFGSS